ncbi:hypothetical protein BU15DRAFT_68353 [Melanogaster broomeanus]|nr:hypothetical protein BU15DRAFT_68353 [Melanogaster broomeanus]
MAAGLHGIRPQYEVQQVEGDPWGMTGRGQEPSDEVSTAPKETDEEEEKRQTSSDPLPDMMPLPPAPVLAGNASQTALEAWMSALEKTVDNLMRMVEVLWKDGKEDEVTGLERDLSMAQLASTSRDPSIPTLSAAEGGRNDSCGNSPLIPSWNAIREESLESSDDMDLSFKSSSSDSMLRNLQRRDHAVDREVMERPDLREVVLILEYIDCPAWPSCIRNKLRLAERVMAGCQAWGISVTLPVMVKCLVRWTVFERPNNKGLHNLLCSKQVEMAEVMRNAPDPGWVFPNAWWLPDRGALSGSHFSRPMAEVHAEASQYFGETEPDMNQGLGMEHLEEMRDRMQEFIVAKRAMLENIEEEMKSVVEEVKLIDSIRRIDIGVPFKGVGLDLAYMSGLMARNIDADALKWSGGTQVRVEWEPRHDWLAYSQGKDGVMLWGDEVDTQRLLDEEQSCHWTGQEWPVPGLRTERMGGEEGWEAGKRDTRWMRDPMSGRDADLGTVGMWDGDRDGGCVMGMVAMRGWGWGWGWGWWQCDGMGGDAGMNP